MSKRWSCGTLKDGFEDVMHDTLWQEQQRLEKEVKDPFPSCKTSLHHWSFENGMAQKMSNNNILNMVFESLGRIGVYIYIMFSIYILSHSHLI